MRSAFPHSDPAHGEAPWRCSAHKPDHDGAGHDGQHPAAASVAQSMPRRSRCASSWLTMGLAFTLVSVRASSSSTQLNMKQKNAAPTPALISGRKMVRRSAEAVAVDVGRLVDLARDAAHEAFENPHRQRHVEEQVRQRHRDVRVHQAHGGVELKERQQNTAGGVMRLVSSQKNTCLSPRNW